MGLHNVLRESPVPSPIEKCNFDVENMASAFGLMIDEPMLQHVIKCTETEDRKKLQYETWSLSVEEMEAFIGLLYLRGVCGAKGLPLACLWSAKWSIRFYCERMSRNRFQEILRFIRFDVKSSKPGRLEQDKFTLVSDIWNRFISNSISSYKPGDDITVDEQLFLTKAKCRFTQYMSSKPDKFGIKFWLAVDVDSKYILNGFLYLGKDEKWPSDQSLSEKIILRLVDPYIDTGRNITMDNFFTSVNLAEKLKARGTSVVGTVNRSRRDIPAGVKNAYLPLQDSFIMNHNDCTLTVYQGKVNKNVLVLSNIHASVSIGVDKKRLPETISYYNSTKFGVDIAEQMARRYSTKAASWRWPLQVFYNILDFDGINSWILFKETTGSSISHTDLIINVAEQLREGNLRNEKKAKEGNNQDTVLCM
ncbi:hypothetical protein PR048_018099 [Dryococelus australis]|uniref:PiggyBac transposable element-derived protein domain-containing protein n=1 Tax=Dryococelus australis TaxID=614101 RepID=A0ABQ9HBF3_9NEOP|nr:hypothetical protein PR048_018099 [Dryococelus australis]